jgi:hypothetical protein
LTSRCSLRYKKTDITKIEPLHGILSLKNKTKQNKTITEKKEGILKDVKEKNQITCKSKPIKTIADFSTETLKARRALNEVYPGLKENNYSPRIDYPTKLSITIDGRIKSSMINTN